TDVAYRSPQLAHGVFRASGQRCYSHSFPTRRSSDLGERLAGLGAFDEKVSVLRHEAFGGAGYGDDLIAPEMAAAGVVIGRGRKRSEEHTSELQSRVDLVCRLLLEKQR